MVGTSCGGGERGCSFCSDAEVEQEAGGQQAQVGSWRAGVKGVPKRSNGKVSGLRRKWKALWLLG